MSNIRAVARLAGVSVATVSRALKQPGLVSERPRRPCAAGRFDKQLDQALEAAHKLGHRYLVLPWLEEKQRDTESFKRPVDQCNRWGEKCREAGVRFAYHNHPLEFEADGDFVPYD